MSTGTLTIKHECVSRLQTRYFHSPQVLVTASAFEAMWVSFIIIEAVLFSAEDFIAFLSIYSHDNIRIAVASDYKKNKIKLISEAFTKKQKAVK